MSNILNEPAVAYTYDKPFKALLLNSYPEAKGNQLFMEYSRNGVEKSSIKILADFMGLNQETISTFLHSSFRNIQRKSDDELLDKSKSERLLELTAFAKKAVEVLGSQEALGIWLQSSLPALSYNKPVEYLDTSFGLNILYDILGRIEHGVYA
ncbi:type II RES/Xre toxin-antitoxin system antitoxin [Jiulongibacter sediminis]|uniref:type II RES/Xre toxin-antitoxin system antitoxin n=1 Tax=Jiulongibacter sediminis TaxID=1605367 RepID=UPI0006DCE2B3|nr:antitoxin Xre/MbcA/ParS toxin-binding domain-containing protein [Jiulongibacter sediminis]